MAVDTADKRRTAFGWTFLPGFLGESPSGAVGASARLGVYSLYSGIAASVVTVLDLGKLRALEGHEFAVDAGHEYEVIVGHRWRVVEIR